LNSETESGSDLDLRPTQRKCHHANKLQTNSKRTLQVLKATLNDAHSYHGKATAHNVFITHPDSGASNHMTHKFELFNSTMFKTLSKPITISLGDNSKIFATRKGLIHLVFNVKGKKKEGKFEDVLYIPELKVMLLSVRQSACLPHCKVIFNNNICKYIDKNTDKVIAHGYASNNTDLYTLDATPVTQKVAANLTSSSSQSIDVNILHRHLGHLGIDNCHVIVNHRLMDGVDKIVGKEEFCEGCAYGCSKQKHHPSTGTKTKRQLERIHIDLCGPLPNSLGGNQYFLLIIDEHTHYQWVEFLPKKSDAFMQLKKWKLQAKQETDLKLQYLKSDGGKEFGSKVFEDWLTTEGVIHEKSTPYEHEQNGLAERGIQNVSQWAICQLFGANMLEGVWLYAVETTVYLINHCPTTTLKDKTPFEAWTGKCLNIKHLHTFGEMGYVHIPPETHKKWTRKSCPCRFLGYTL
jgi:GAG-pre-integrase domain